MERYIRSFANLSLAKCYLFITEPWRVPLFFQRPAMLSDKDAILSLFPNLSPEAVESCLLEFLRDERFFSEMNKLYLEKRFRRVNSGGMLVFLYLAVRFAKPQIVLETGVFDGLSSAVILEALRGNGSGELISIDLPAIRSIDGSTHMMPESSLPPDCQPGWTIPDYLRDRHRLILGDSKEIMPPLLQEYEKIDIFFHDSLHTFEHQHFEYITAWPKLSEGGLLISDDIAWSAAFHKFSRQIGKPYVCIGSVGAVRK